jgi:type IV pilus assembly protein PilO
MSTTPVVTSNENNSLLRRVPQLTERAKALVTELNLHFAGVAVLLVVTLYLAAQMLFVWQSLNSRDQAALDQARLQMKAAEIAAKPLRGLDGKLAGSTADADEFYQKRLPFAYSQVLTELGALSKHEGVRLMHVQYAQAPVLSNSNYALTELRLDANVTGDYRPSVQFINAAERDKLFFVINTINLTGQQGGAVNLRLRMTTYLRSAGAGETNTLPADDAEKAADSSKGGQR